METAAREYLRHLEDLVTELQQQAEVTRTILQEGVDMAKTGLTQRWIHEHIIQEHSAAAEDMEPTDWGVMTWVEAHDREHDERGNSHRHDTRFE